MQRHYEIALRAQQDTAARYYRLRSDSVRRPKLQYLSHLSRRTIKSIPSQTVPRDMRGTPKCLLRAGKIRKTRRVERSYNLVNRPLCLLGIVRMISIQPPLNDPIAARASRSRSLSIRARRLSKLFLPLATASSTLATWLRMYNLIGTRVRPR